MAKPFESEKPFVDQLNALTPDAKERRFEHTLILLPQYERIIRRQNPTYKEAKHLVSDVYMPQPGFNKIDAGSESYHTGWGFLTTPQGLVIPFGSYPLAQNQRNSLRFDLYTTWTKYEAREWNEKLAKGQVTLNDGEQLRASSNIYQFDTYQDASDESFSDFVAVTEELLEEYWLAKKDINKTHLARVARRNLLPYACRNDIAHDRYNVLIAVAKAGLSQRNVTVLPLGDEAFVIKFLKKDGDETVRVLPSFGKMTPELKQMFSLDPVTGEILTYNQVEALYKKHINPNAKLF